MAATTRACAPEQVAAMGRSYADAHRWVGAET